MKKQMKRTVYEAPVTERFQVELEGTFCASADITNKDDNNIGINDQQVNTGFTEGADFGDTGWDPTN